MTNIVKKVLEIWCYERDDQGLKKKKAEIEMFDNGHLVDITGQPLLSVLQEQWDHGRTDFKFVHEKNP